ncbi:hypothetical protein V8C26DRAFT_22653 [Trichoderma gracile]
MTTPLGRWIRLIVVLFNGFQGLVVWAPLWRLQLQYVQWFPGMDRDLSPLVCFLMLDADERPTYSCGFIAELPTSIAASTIQGHISTAKFFRRLSPLHLSVVRRPMNRKGQILPVSVC